MPDFSANKTLRLTRHSFHLLVNTILEAAPERRELLLQMLRTRQIPNAQWAFETLRVLRNCSYYGYFLKRYYQDTPTGTIEVTVQHTHREMLTELSRFQFTEDIQTLLLYAYQQAMLHLQEDSQNAAAAC